MTCKAVPGVTQDHQRPCTSTPAACTTDGACPPEPGDPRGASKTSGAALVSGPTEGLGPRSAVLVLVSRNFPRTLAVPSEYRTCGMCPQGGSRGTTVEGRRVRRTCTAEPERRRGRFHPPRLWRRRACRLARPGSPLPIPVRPLAPARRRCSAS